MILKKQKALDRRNFIKMSLLGSLSLTSLSLSLESLIAEESGTSILWFSGISPMLNQSSLYLNDSLFSFLKKKQIKHVSSDRFGTIGLDKGKHILLLEGGFLKKKFSQQLDKYLENAKAVILVGNEACFNSFLSEDHVDLLDYTQNRFDKPTICLPGYPLNTSHLLTTLNYLYLYGIPEVDELRRPLLFFGEKVCDFCELRKDLEQGNFKESFADENGCLFKLGCKGPFTNNSCAKSKWNETQEWCVSSGSPCSGCSEPSYPSHLGLGFYKQLENDTLRPDRWVKNLDKLLVSTSLLTIGGVAAHTLSQKSPNYLKTEQLDEFYKADIEKLISEDEEPQQTINKK